MRWGNLSAECFLRPKSDLRSCGEKRRLRNHPAERELLLRDFRDACASAWINAEQRNTMKIWSSLL
jgi:hypothetical protein